MKKQMVSTAKRKTKGVPGPKAEAVKLEGNWKALVKTALGKKKPAEGWPDAPKKKATKG